MALSGNNLQKASWNNKFGIHFYWSGKQNVAGNYTDITVDIYGWLDTYAYLDIGSRNGSISIAGDNKGVWMPSVKKYDSNVREFKLASRTVRVRHRDDGTLPNVYISAVWTIQATIDNVYRANISCGFNTGEINRIPRASSISSNSSFTIGNNFPVTIKRASDSFKHDVFLRINNSNFKTVSKIDTNHTFTFTDNDIDNLYELTKNSSSIDCSLICDTYSGNTKIGSVTKNGKVYVDEATNKPVFDNFTFVPIDLGTKDLTGWTTPVNEDNGLSIKNKTMYQIKCEEAISKNKSTIVRYELELNKKISSSTNTTIIANTPIEYDGFISVSAVDSRGFKTTISKKITCQNYENVNIDNWLIDRQNFPNNATVIINLNGTITKTNTLNNNATAYYRYGERLSSDGQFTEWKQIDLVVESNGNFSIPDAVIENFDLKKVYDFELKINDYYEDYYENKNVIKTIIKSDKPIFSIKKDGIYSLGEKIEANQKNIVSLVSSQGRNVTTKNSWEAVQVYFQNKTIIGDKLSFNETDNTVVIGKNVSTVEISANCSYVWNGLQTGEIQLSVLKNNNNILSCSTNKPAGQMCFNCITPILCDVSEGDAIKLVISMNGAGLIGYTANKTFMKIEVIE